MKESISFRVDKELLENIDKIAAELHLSRTAIIIMALNDKIDEHTMNSYLKSRKFKSAKC